MESAKDEACASEYSDDKESEVNLNILEEHFDFEELNVDPVSLDVCSDCGSRLSAASNGCDNAIVRPSDRRLFRSLCSQVLR